MAHPFKFNLRNKQNCALPIYILLRHIEYENEYRIDPRSLEISGEAGLTRLCTLVSSFMYSSCNFFFHALFQLN